LKEYQNEIDSMSKRLKYSDGLFLDLYKILAELPDPCTVFYNLLGI
jgi:hypothetical protein